MKYSTKLFLLIAPFIFFYSSVAYSFEGPLQVKNQYPLFLHVNQPFLEKASLENSFSLSISHSSTYTVESSGVWLIALDMEITEFNLRYKRILKDSIELDIEIPVLYFGDGFMDGFLNSYHSTFGFPDYGRSLRPENVFLYQIKRNGNVVLEGETGAGLGDIRLAVKGPLISSDGFELSVKGDLEFPTGSAKKGYGNGNLDIGLSVLIDKRISDTVMTYWNFGAVFPGNVKGFEEVRLDNFMYGGAVIEAVFGKHFSLLAQLLGQSSIYPETGVTAVDRNAFLIVFGLRFIEGKGNFELSLAEDINVSGAPDFIINLSYKLRL